MLVFIIVLFAALIFEYTNGFHDAANAIATVVSTKVLTPRQAILLASICNLIGAFIGTAVAKTIGEGLVEKTAITTTTVLCALIAAITWNLITWSIGLPSSSSHALVGGLCGAAFAVSDGNWSVLKWSTWDPVKKTAGGLWPKIVEPMVISPVVGFFVGALLMAILTAMLVRSRPSKVHDLFGRLQLFSAGLMGISHGTNDAQKTMGIITLALFTTTKAGAFDHLPARFHFLRTPGFDAIPAWVIMLCAATMALGTAAGGWRIIRTLGHKIVKMQPVHGFAAETTAACIIQTASHFGIPLSTTHVISTSIMGVGATKRFGAVKWGVVQRIVWAWVLTLPITSLLGYSIFQLVKAL